MQSKYFNYLLFAAIGILCAEFLSLSTPFTLLSPFLYWGYGLLYLLLFHIIIKYNLRDFKSYYLLGLFIGIITETFITKVLYNVPWHPEGMKVLGFGIIDSLALTLFWHPVLAFAVPVLISNYYFGFPNPKGVISRKRMNILVGILPLFVVSQSISANVNIFSILSGMAVNFVVLTAYIFLFRRFSSDKIMLSKKTLFFILFFIIISFGFAYFTLVPYFPSPLTLGITFAIIGIFLLLNYLNIKQNKNNPAKSKKPSFQWKGYLLYIGYFLAFFILLNRFFILFPQPPILFMIFFLFLMVLGTGYFLLITLGIVKALIIQGKKQ